MKISEKIAQSGCQVNPGATDEIIENFEKAKNLNIDSYITEIYREFNGFPKFEALSYREIHIWSLSEVLESNVLIEGLESYFPFADEFISADTYLCNFSDKHSPVLSFNENEQIAESLPLFWAKVLANLG